MLGVGNNMHTESNIGFLCFIYISLYIYLYISIYIYVTYFCVCVETFEIILKVENIKLLLNII